MFRHGDGAEYGYFLYSMFDAASFWPIVSDSRLQAFSLQKPIEPSMTHIAIYIVKDRELSNDKKITQMKRPPMHKEIAWRHRDSDRANYELYPLKFVLKKYNYHNKYTLIR